MQVIETKKGKFYRECIYISGRPYFSPRFTRKSDAVAWKSKKNIERSEYLATGVIPQPAQTFHAIFFKDYATNWLENRIKVRSSRRTYENYSSVLRNHLLPFFKDRPMNLITVFDVDALTAKLSKKGHNAKGTNIIFGVLRSIVLSAVRDELLEKDPLRHYKPLRENPRGDVFMTAAEIRDLFNANLNEEHYPLFVMALNTGLRKGELAGLCWDMIHFDNNLIEIARSRDRFGLADRLKTEGSRRYVPMNKDVRRLLMDLKRKSKSEFVLTTKEGKAISCHHIYRYFSGALKKAGIRRQIRFHDLRHTFASHFMMNGGNIYDLQKILGHTNIKMTQRYAHLAPEHLVGAANIVSFASCFERDREQSQNFTANIQPKLVESF